MFTGIIAEIGIVKNISRRKDSVALTIECEIIAAGVNIGDSVAVNGVCLSVVKNKSDLVFDVVENTWKKTDLSRLRTGSKVNLENALKMGEDISGHMVSGHIDCERKILNNRKAPNGWILDVEIKPEDKKTLVLRGSVAIDGVSLTIGEIDPNYFRIFIIPHTLKNTILEYKKRGDHVNIEFDMIAKYAEKQEQGTRVMKKTLLENGFI